MSAGVKADARSADIEKVSFTVTPQLRLIALAGILAVLGLATMLLMLSRTSEPAETASVAPTPRRDAEPARKELRIHRPPASKRPRGTPRYSADVPVSVSRALATHSVVVVSLWAPRSHTDEVASGEAKAGAALGGAGFVRLNVLDERETGRLSERLGVLQDPAVLVYRRGDETPYLRIDGFADRDAVAQAAANAASARRSNR